MILLNRSSDLALRSHESRAVFYLVISLADINPLEHLRKFDRFCEGLNAKYSKPALEKENAQTFLTGPEGLSRNRQYREKLVANTGHNCILPDSCSQFMSLQQDSSVALPSVLSTKSRKPYVIERFRDPVRGK
jgi:hypothetical protein